MGFWSRLAQRTDDAPPVAAPPAWTMHVFGKVPAHRDFLRLGLPTSDDEALLSLESWTARAMEETTGELSPLWTALQGEGATVAQLHRASLEGGKRAHVAAVSIPSVDAVGRRFPLVACARLADDRFAQAPHLAPIALATFLREATTLLREVQSLDVAEVRRRVSTMRLSALPGAHEQVLPYELWMRGTTLGRCALKLFGADVGELARAIAAIDTHTAPLRGRESSNVRASLRFPIADDPYYAAFGIDLVRRLAQWRQTVPDYLISGDEQHGTLHVALGGDAAPALLAEAFGARSSARIHVHDLGEEAGDRARLRPEVRALLAAPDATLAQLVASLNP